jgi:hypothetical protein
MHELRCYGCGSSCSPTTEPHPMKHYYTAFQRLLTLMLALFILTGLHAQRTCGTMEHLEQELQQDPERALRLQMIEDATEEYLLSLDPSEGRSTVIIPVVFHVVWRTTAENISDAKIMAQLQQLNDDFARLNADAGNTPSLFQGVAANTQVQFCLAQRDPSGNTTTGIVRRQTTVTSFSSNNAVKYTSNGGSDAWPRDSYLNVWSCNLSNGLLGYAQFPGGSAATDGVVVLYSTVGSLTNPGTASPYNLGRTLTHEVGHWLNLRHIWGDATCGNDFVSDTPVHNASNYGCPTYPHYSTCSGSPVEMTMNYMDYTDDGCMNMFSSGQGSRMQALFASGGARAPLLASLGCVPPGGTTTCSTPTGLAAGNITSSAASLSWNGVSGALSYDLQYRASGTTAWTVLNTTATSSTLSGLATSTTYEAQVRAVCSDTRSDYSSSVFFSTASTGCSDALEPNNSTTAPADVVLPLSINALIASSSDADYYRFSLGATSNISIGLSNLPGDYDLRLLNGSGSQLAISQAGGTSSEVISYTNAPAGTYFIHVYGYNGAFSTSQCYALTASATVVQSCDVPSGLAASGITSSAAGLSWNAVSLANSYDLQYRPSSSSSWATVNLTGTSTVLSGLAESTSYVAQVRANCSFGSSAYSASITFTTAGSGCTDTWESNNTSGTAKLIPVNTDIFATIGGSTDLDWYRFSNTSSQRRIRIDLTNLPANYDVRLYRGTNTQVGISQNSGTTDEVIIFNTNNVNTYYIRVSGANGAFNASQCYTLRASISGTNFREMGGSAMDLEADNAPSSGLMSIYPNPAQERLMIDYLAEQNGSIYLVVLDGLGREVLVEQRAVTEGPGTYSLDLPTLAEGLYVLSIRSGDARYQQRFIIKR